MSATERRALLLLLGLGLAGQVVRWWATRPDEAPGQIELLEALPPKSPLAHRDSIAALTRPLGPGERIDADRAGAAELARLPRVGLALAKTIVADRQNHGTFGSLQGLDRVPGIGPGLLAAIGKHVVFGGQPGSRAGGPERPPGTALRRPCCSPSSRPACPSARRPACSPKPQFRDGFRARAPSRNRPGPCGGDFAGARGAGAVFLDRSPVPRTRSRPCGRGTAARPCDGMVMADASAPGSSFRYCPRLARSFLLRPRDHGDRSCRQ